MSLELTPRQRDIFRAVVEGHIKIGQPIPSEWVVSRVRPPVSGATVRAELLALEQTGLLRSPHTSAGRVPTEDGYRWYLSEFVNTASAPARGISSLEEHLELEPHTSPAEKIRTMARELSELAGAVAIVGLDPHLLYATGMGRMMEAPEAEDVAVVRRITAALDRADELLDELYDVASSRTDGTEDVRVLIGTHNPIDENCSLLVTRVSTSEGDRLLALLGFMRMRYKRNLAILHSMKKYIEREV